MNTIIFRLQSIQNVEQIQGPFYVIENFPFPQYVLDEDGNTKSFDSYDEALEEANNCQDGYVIEL